MSPIPLGIFAVSGAAPVVAGDMELIATILITSNTTNIDFASIPQTYRHLQIRFTARSTNSSQSIDNLLYPAIGSSPTTADHVIFGNGTSGDFRSSANRSDIRTGEIAGSLAAVNIFSVGLIDIMNYTSTTSNKTVRFFVGHTVPSFSKISAGSGLASSTSAITDLRLTTSPGQYVAGSRFSLYGIKG